MDKQEKIVSPAVRFAIAKEDYNGIKVVTGVDYESIYNDGVLSYLVHGQYTNIWQNGFITSKKRFVDSIEAQKIAIACGQYRDPHARIKLLESSIEIGWDSVKYAKTGVMISSLKKRIVEDQETLDALKAGYLGNALRVEDLHYV